MSEIKKTILEEMQKRCDRWCSTCWWPVTGKCQKCGTDDLMYYHHETGPTWYLDDIFTEFIFENYHTVDVESEFCEYLDGDEIKIEICGANFSKSEVLKTMSLATFNYELSLYEDAQLCIGRFLEVGNEIFEVHDIEKTYETELEKFMPRKKGPYYTKFDELNNKNKDEWFIEEMKKEIALTKSALEQLEKEGENEN